MIMAKATNVKTAYFVDRVVENYSTLAIARNGRGFQPRRKRLDQAISLTAIMAVDINLTCSSKGVSNPRANNGCKARASFGLFLSRWAAFRMASGSGKPGVSFSM
jgi:hypothetical protein